MFFSWYLENRHFKKGVNLKGQVTPLLLVVLAILLIAAVATVNIGRVSLDKTCSANGADAGSLAAASAWSGAFNSLALMNEQLQIYYDMNYYTYGQLYFTANDYINEAIFRCSEYYDVDRKRIFEYFMDFLLFHYNKYRLDYNVKEYVDLYTDMILFSIENKSRFIVNRN